MTSTGTCARRWRASRWPPRARGRQATDIRVGMRTGDTPADERRAFGKHPPDILVTTPESLYLLLTSAAREALRSVEWVIVDEIHALAGHQAWRAPGAVDGAAERHHTAATTTHRVVRDPAAAVRSGSIPGWPGQRSAWHHAPAPARPVTIVDAGVRKPLELQVIVPVEDMGRLGEVDPARRRRPAVPPQAGEQRTSIWPSVYPRVLELIRSHRSTIVFANSRRLAERLALKLNELAGEDLVRAHHGSLAREQRLIIEEMLKEGPPARARGHELAGAGHRHGCRGPGHPGRIAAVGGTGPATGRPGRAPGWRAVEGHHLPQVPRRPAGMCRGHAADARGGHRAHRRAPQPAGRAGPADRGRLRGATLDRGRAVRPCAGRRELRGAGPGVVRGGPGHARGPVSQRRVR